MGSGEVEVVLFVEVGSCVCCLFRKGYWMCVRSVKNRVKNVIYMLPCEGECPVGFAYFDLTLPPRPSGVRGDWSLRLVPRTRFQDVAGFISVTAWAAIFRSLKTDQESRSLWSRSPLGRS